MTGGKRPTLGNLHILYLGRRQSRNPSGVRQASSILVASGQSLEKNISPWFFFARVDCHKYVKLEVRQIGEDQSTNTSS